MIMNQLAIIIPAYKIDFFERTLQSLADQTCKDFTVYVGDDCSPADFKGLIEKYQNQLDIHYTKFETNMGGKDLVAQWERCVDLSQGEPWLWLFSDDDELEPNCVECFYKTINNTDAQSNVYHFGTFVIDDKSDIVRKSPEYPQSLYGYDYYKKKMLVKIDSFVVENIFRRSVYRRNNGFAKFDMAWGADTASWVIFAGDQPIQTIHGACVRWRQSDLNITPNTSKDVLIRKLNALLNFLQWSFDQFKNKRSIKLFNFIFTIKRFHYYAKGLEVSQVSSISKNYLMNNFGSFGYKSIIFLTRLLRIW